MAVAFDAKFTADVLTTGAGPFTVTGATSGLTVGSGSNRVLVILVVLVDGTTGRTVTSAHWDSAGTNQAATLIGRATQFSWSAELWGLVAPTSGNLSLNVAISGTCSDVFIDAASFTGVNQTGGVTSFAHFNTAITASSALPSIAITSAVGNIAIGVESSTSANVAGTFNNTTIFGDDGGTGSGGANYGAGAASVTLSSSANQVNGFIYAGCDIVAAAGAGDTFGNNMGRLMM